MMIIAMLMVAVMMISISYMAMKILSEVVVTPPTPLRKLADEPREAWRLPGEKVVQLQVSPEGDRVALLSSREESGEEFIRIYSLGDYLEPLYYRVVKGYQLGWLPGNPSTLVYEDGGGIWRLDGVDREPVNLTAGISDYNTEPLPSPDGRLILWKRSVAEEGGRISLWCMRPDGSEPRKLSGTREMASWNPDGASLAAYQKATRSEISTDEYYLETIELTEGEQEFFTAGTGQMRYVNWLNPSTILYVSIYVASDASEAEVVVYQVDLEAGPEERALGTLNSLNDPNRSYTFFLSKERERLAYQGGFGLEFYDVTARRAYRETRILFFTALDWMPGGEELIYAQDDIIYNMKVDTSNVAP